MSNLLFLDTADISEIQRFKELGLISGVTTNPVLLRAECIKTDTKPLDLIAKICNLCADLPVSAQVVSSTYEARIAEVDSILGIATNAIAKLPADPLTMEMLSKNPQILDRVNITAVFNVATLYLFSLFSPKYISCIFDKNEDWGVDHSFESGCISNYNVGMSKLIGASIRNALSLSNHLSLGFDILTVPPSTLKSSLSDVRSQHVIQSMNEGWESILYFPDL